MGLIVQSSVVAVLAAAMTLVVATLAATQHWQPEVAHLSMVVTTAIAVVARQQ